MRDLVVETVIHLLKAGNIETITHRTYALQFLALSPGFSCLENSTEKSVIHGAYAHKRAFLCSEIS